MPLLCFYILIIIFLWSLQRKMYTMSKFHNNKNSKENFFKLLQTFNVSRYICKNSAFCKYWWNICWTEMICIWFVWQLDLNSTLTFTFLRKASLNSKFHCLHTFLFHTIIFQTDVIILVWHYPKRYFMHDNWNM
jgi:hypothetical protein